MTILMKQSNEESHEEGTLSQPNTKIYHNIHTKYILA